MSSGDPSSGARVFISYSHKDEGLREQLENHLATLRRNGVVSHWNDRKILPGQNWAAEIDQRINDSDIFLALVSSDFLASDYCYEKEMKLALQRHGDGQMIVVPIILRPVDWHDSLLGALQALPKDGKPVTAWTNVDEAFRDIAAGIKRLLGSRVSGP
jgi:internalin A